jgi:adenylate cyclase
MDMRPNAALGSCKMALIEYQNDGEFDEKDLNLTLLEMSLKHGIPHMHVCGGTARCSTCRVMVLEHPENVLPRNGLEQRLVARKGLEDNIRLACQTRVTGPVKLRRLALDDQDADLAIAVPQETSGREARIAVMFSDIRDFTVFSERHLPYDTIHILNRYFYQMGEAILHNNGYIDKYMGDGIMALFGVDNNNPEQNCYNAVNAGLEMLYELDKLNSYLRKAFECDFKIGIGIHFGEVILGELGHPDRRSITVIGDVVNTASRIESSTKTYGIPLLISDSVRYQLRDRIDTGKIIDAALKGKTGMHKLYEVVKLYEEAKKEDPQKDREKKLLRAMNDVVNLQKAPLFVRLAFHDAATYSESSQTGGANGSIRLPGELAREENKGLSAAIEVLKPVKAQFPDVSWADIIALAGALSIQRTGGPVIPLPMGRTDVDEVSPEGRIPLKEWTLDQIKDRFLDMGMTTQEMVALTGAHTIGRQSGMPFTDDWFQFSNSFFKMLLGADERMRSLMQTDRFLGGCSDCRQWVERYAEDQDAFFQDFAAAYRKMTLLGTGLETGGKS